MSDDDEVDAAVAAAGAELLAAVEAALPGWVERSVLDRAPHLRDEAAAAAVECVESLLPVLRELLEADIDDQRLTPLQLVRAGGPHPTLVLQDAGVAPPSRDPWEVEADPDDVYGLGPAAWADLGPDVHEAGLRWGAAKAFSHLRRHPPGS